MRTSPCQSGLVLKAYQKCKDWSQSRFFSKWGKKTGLDRTFKGSNINQGDDEGHTPLHWAAQSGHTFLCCIVVGKRSDGFDALNKAGEDTTF